MTRKSILAVINPFAGKHGAGWAELRVALEARGMQVDESWTERPGHASELAAAGDHDLVLAAGGDGTVSEVAAGLLRRADTGSRPVLGIMPLGTGNDYQRTARALVTGEDLAARIAEAEPATVDAGRIRFESGDRADEFFINAANAGFSAAVAERAEHSFRSWPRMAGYAVSAIATLASFRNPSVHLEIDGASEEFPANSIVMALGRYFGQGMKVAPDAVADDGLFDIITVGDIGRLELVAAYPRLYTGSHIHHGKVSVRRGRRVSIRAERPLTVEGDGNIRGTLPAIFEVLPGALRVIA